MLAEPLSFVKMNPAWLGVRAVSSAGETEVISSSVKIFFSQGKEILSAFYRLTAGGKTDIQGIGGQIGKGFQILFRNSRVYFSGKFCCLGRIYIKIICRFSEARDFIFLIEKMQTRVVKISDKGWDK